MTSSSSDPNPSPSAAPLQSSPLSSPTSSVTSYLGHPENVVHGQHIRASLADPRRATDIFPKFMRRLMNTRLEVPNTSISTDYQAVGYVVFNDNDQQLSIDTALEASVKATRTHNALHILRTLRDNPGDNDRDVTSSKSPTRDSPLCIQNIRAETTTTLPIISSTRTFIESKSLGVDIVDISTTSIPQHGPDYILPTSYSRIANTFQLVYCCSVLSKWEKESNSISVSASSNSQELLSLSDKERDWAALIDPFEKSHYYGLVDQLVRTFIEDPFKNPETIAEVVLVGTVLDKDTYCVLLSSFIAELTERNLRYLDILQGLVQLVECVSCEHLVDDDLVRIAIVLLNKLSVAHAGSNDHYLYLIWALSRILAVMAEVNVMKLNHSRDHQPTLQFLAGLNISSNIYVKYQAAYAYQALQYISNDDTSLQFAWRYIQGDAHVASAVTTLIRIDPSEFLKGVAGLTSAYEVPDVFAAAFEVGKAAGEDARTPFEAPLRIAGDASRSFKKRSWYLILQGTALYLRQGQFQDFKTIVSHAPCRNDPNFQWGICRQLGEIAADLLLDIHIRRQAVEFLFGLYRGHTSLKLHNDVKQWILIILSQVSDLSNSFLEEYGIPAIEYLKDIGISELPGLYPLNARLAQPKSFPLLVKVQNIPEVEYRLHALRSRRIKEYKDTQKLYIPPMAKPNLGAKDDTCFPLIDKVEEFLESNCQVMLILGDSGAGKSSFNRYLEYKLWQGYKSGSRIPLFINLPGIEKPDVDIIQKQLGIYNFTEFQIQELLQHRQLTLICDGYDESQLGCNLHTANRLNQSNQNDTKLIITCRSQYLGRDYYDRFVPNAAGQYNRGAYHLFQECVISSFSKTQVEGYVEQYVSLEPRIWTKTEYLKKLETIPNLMDLVRNPYLLTLCLEAFPTVIRDESESETDLSRVRVTRVLLYDRFVQHWLSAHKRRFHEVKMTNIKQQAFNALLDQGFEWNAFTYQMELAVAIFEKQDGHPVVDCFRKQDLNEWKVKFFGPDPEKELFRDSSLLIRAGTQYWFLHQSILEYFYSCTFYRPTIEGDMRDMQDHSSTDGHPLSKCNLVNKPSIIQFLAERTIQNANFKQQLLEIIDQSKNNQKAAQAAQAAANAITILVRAGVRFHGQNFQGIRIPGANLSGGLFDSAQFQEADLRGIKLIGSWIRQVDFSKTLMQGVEFGELPYLQFTSTVWSCAYSPDGRILAVGLSKDIILYDTADWRLISILEGHEDGVRGLAFSPSGDRLLSGSFDRTVRLWNYMTRTVDFILDGHTRGVISVAYSPCGKQVASVGRDGVVRLWDVRSGSAAIALSGHTDWIRGVVYSPDGMSFATASLDGTIRVYETRTSSVTFVVECGNEYISSVAFSPDDIRSVAFSPDGIRSIAYSPDGSKIVSGHSNGRIQLWDSVTGERLQSWQGHREYINRVIFSPSGQWIASCGDDKTVELWSTQTGKLVSSLSGHQWEVKDIVFSPIGSILVSGSVDETVRFWDLSIIRMEPSRECDRSIVYSVFSNDRQCVISVDRFGFVQRHNILTGELEQLTACGYTNAWKASMSADGQQIAIVELMDCHVQVFRIESGLREFILSGHKKVVSTIAYSPNGRMIATGSWDTTICLWDTKSGDSVRVLIGHKAEVKSLQFSPNSQQMVSVDYNNVVLIWEIDTGISTHFYTGHDFDGFSMVAFSPSGRQIAVSNPRQAIVNIWVELSNRVPRVLHHGFVLLPSFAWSHCEQWIATTCYNSVMLWNRSFDRSKNETCDVIVRGIHGRICSISWKPGSLEFVTGCDDGSIQVWRLINTLDRWSVRLIWSVGNNVLDASEAIFSDAIGLSAVNQQLLVQHNQLI